MRHASQTRFQLGSILKTKFGGSRTDTVEQRLGIDNGDTLRAVAITTDGGDVLVEIQYAPGKETPGR